MSESAVVNKTHYDLLKTAYAKATVDDSTGAITYATPVVIPGSVSLKLTVQGDLTPDRADGGVYIIDRDNKGYDGDLEFERVPEAFETDILGETKNSDGTIEEGEDDVSSPFALLFEFKGDKKAIKHCLFYCMASKPDDEGDNPDKKKPVHSKFKISAIPRPTDGKIKTKTGDTTTSTVADAWYTAVPTVASGD